METDDAAPDEHDTRHDDDASDVTQAGFDGERRRFLVTAAEVAALSLFGIFGFDDLANRVLVTLSKMRDMRVIADAATRQLETAGLVGAAHAYNCETVCAVMAHKECHVDDAYGNCNGPGEPKYVCDGNNPGETYNCAWMDFFYCTIPRDFECVDYTCRSTRWQFHCSEENGFGCQYPDQFHCGGTQGDAFLCPGGNAFHDNPCQIGGRYDCNQGTGEYSICTDVNCPGSFNCGNATGTFECETGFTCSDFDCENNSGSIYDFGCSGGFGCMGHFDCMANHLFACAAGDTGDHFCATYNCLAGGNQCNIPGTGNYSFDGPGDFYCASPPTQGGQFQCMNFQCTAVDDFMCLADFACDQQHQCTGVGGAFGCSLGAEFGCPGFSCVPVDKFEGGG